MIYIFIKGKQMPIKIHLSAYKALVLSDEMHDAKHKY